MFFIATVAASSKKKKKRSSIIIQLLFQWKKVWSGIYTDSLMQLKGGMDAFTLITF